MVSIGSTISPFGPPGPPSYSPLNSPPLMIPLGPPIPLYVPLFKGKRDNEDNEDEDDGKRGAWKENKDQGGHNSKENFENKDKIKGSYGSKYGGWKNR